MAMGIWGLGWRHLIPSLIHHTYLEYILFVSHETDTQGFPGGTIVKNPPANAGDTGSSPGLGRSHVLHSN